VNVGILGAGNISDTHARAARAAGLQVVAVFGDNRDKARRLAEQHEATAFDSLDALLRHPTLDLVMIGSPSGCHADHATAAVRAGRHVLVEKPLDISTPRIDSLLNEVARANVTLGVFFQDRLKPDIVEMKRRIDAGNIGTIVLATGEVKWFRPPEYYAASRWRGTWALDGGGALMNQGIHTVDLMLYLLGPVTRLSGSIATRFHKIEAEDTQAGRSNLPAGRWARSRRPRRRLQAGRVGSRSLGALTRSCSRVIISSCHVLLRMASVSPAPRQPRPSPRMPARPLCRTCPRINASSKTSSTPFASGALRCAMAARAAAASKSSKRCTAPRVKT